MAETINKDAFNSGMTESYRELGDSVSDLMNVGRLCRLCVLNLTENGRSFSGGKLKDDRLRADVRHFVVEEEEFSMLRYAVFHLSELTDARDAKYHEQWEKVRRAAIKTPEECG